MKSNITMIFRDDKNERRSIGTNIVPMLRGVETEDFKICVRIVFVNTMIDYVTIIWTITLAEGDGGPVRDCLFPVVIFATDG